MESVEQLLSSAARSLEPEVKSRLQGFLGGLVRAYLPQTWTFRTPDGSASLTLDAGGNASVVAGEAPSADVTVELERPLLKRLLLERANGGVPPGAVRVTPHTAKGRAAFGFLRGRLGL